MKRWTTVMSLVASLLLAGIVTNYSQTASDTAPPIPNGINIGGISIGVVNFVRKPAKFWEGLENSVREPAKVRVWLVFRYINEKWFPQQFSLRIADDRGNEYKTQFRACAFSAMPIVGFTWIPDSPIEIEIPEIAPISKFEIVLNTKDIPDRLRGTIPEKFALNYKKLAPFPDLDFKIKPEQVLTGREIKLNEHLSMWLGEPKVLEKVGQKDIEKTIVVSIPITVENRDYNPRAAKEGEGWEFLVQLSNGKIGGGQDWRQRLKIREVKPVSKETFEFSFGAGANENAHARIVWAYKWPYDVGIDLTGKFWGFLPLSAIYGTVIYIYPDKNPKPTEWLVTRETVCYSSDGGKTWDILLTVENIPIDPGFWYKVIDFARVLDRQHIIVHALGHEIETNDGGKTWEAIYYGGSYYGSKVGKFRTQDGGKIWEEKEVLYE